MSIFKCEPEQKHSSCLYDQLMEKGKDFVAFSLAVDEGSDTSDTAQLAVFIC